MAAIGVFGAKAGLLVFSRVTTARETTTEIATSKIAINLGGRRWRRSSLR
jgi:hypothetical protein